MAMEQSMNELEMLGALEDGPTEDSMVVRALGYRLGIADGWFHWDGLAVVFPHFKPEIDILKNAMPVGVDEKDIHLAVDFYSGEALIITRSDTDTGITKIHQTFKLADLLKP